MKKITLMDLRREVGEFIHLVHRHEESFLLTKAGKSVARLLPVASEDGDTVIKPDGTIEGEIPLTFRTNIGEGGY